MLTPLKSLKEKLDNLGVTPQEWAALVAVIEIIHRRKRQSLHYRTGDFFFVVSGLLKQVVEGVTTVSIERFLPTGSPIFISWIDRDSDFAAIEDSIVLKIDAGKLQDIRRRYPALTLSLNTLFEEWMHMLKSRMDLLALPKTERGAAFRERFPGLASRISNIDMAIYLQMSEGYMSKHQ